jgi:phospholipid/cholesterol/gamma-HCH transport system substrate-binding protein
MRDKKLELGVGVFMLVGLAALAYLTIKLGAGALVGADTYPVEARFANAGGVSKGANVSIGGVTVGRVEGIRLDPDDYSAIVDMRVLSAVRLPTDTMASIKTSGLIGDKYIALAPGADEDFLGAAERIIMTESAVELESLIARMAFGSVQESDDEGNENDGDNFAEQP